MRTPEEIWNEELTKDKGWTDHALSAMHEYRAELVKEEIEFLESLLMFRLAFKERVQVKARIHALKEML